MPFSFPFARDAKTYITEAERDFQSQVLLGGPHDPMSLTLAGLIGMNRALLEGDLERLVEEYVGDYASMSCDRLYQAGAGIGLPIRGAEPARGFATLSGLAGTVIPTNLTLTMTGGVYSIDPNVVSPSVIGTDGKAIISIVAQAGGVDGNQEQPGQGVLSFNVPNITTLVSNIVTTGGTNAEDCEGYRKRLAAYEAQDGTPGSIGWHIRRVMRWPGVTRVCLDPCGCCDGQISLYPFFDGVFVNGIPSLALVAEMQSKIFGAEIGSSPFASKIIGITANLGTAVAAPLKVRITGASQTSTDARARIQNDMATYFAALCPGAALCKATLLGIASANGACPRDIVFDFDQSDFLGGCNADETIAACGKLPILTEICYVA